MATIGDVYLTLFMAVKNQSHVVNDTMNGMIKCQKYEDKEITSSSASTNTSRSGDGSGGGFKRFQKKFIKKMKMKK